MKRAAEVSRNNAKKMTKASSGVKQVVFEDKKDDQDVLMKEIPRGLPTSSLIYETMNAFYHRHGDFAYQIDSYEKFLHEYMPAIVQENSTVTVRVDAQKVMHQLKILSLSIVKPTVRMKDGFYHPITPEKAKIGKYTYSLTVFADVEVKTFQLPDAEAVEAGHTQPVLVEEKIFRNNRMWSVPCMVGSSACHSSTPTGIFIINGHEKACINQQEMCTNRPLVMPAKVNSGALYTCEIRSINDRKQRSTSTSYMHIAETRRGIVPEITMDVSTFIKFSIPLHAVFRMLGVDTVDAMVAYVVGGDPSQMDPSMLHLIRSVLEHEAADVSTDAIVEWIAANGVETGTKEQKVRNVRNLFCNEFLPHIGNEKAANPQKVRHFKAIFLGYMVKKLLKVYRGELPVDNRDNMANARLKTVGTLMALLFRQMYLSFHHTVPGSIIRHGMRHDIIKAFTPMRITSGFNSAFSTGKWVKRGGSSAQQAAGIDGVIQSVSSMTSFARRSNLRRINSGISKETKTSGPRQLDASSWGLKCSAQTPEGEACGITQHMAIHAIVRTGFDTEETVLTVTGVAETISWSETPSLDATTVMVNGRIIGFTQKPDVLFEHLWECRRNGSLPRTTSLAHMRHLGEFHVGTDAGCMMRPLFVVRKMHLLCDVFERLRGEHYHPSIFWDELLRHGVIDYVDKDEEAQGRVAYSPKDIHHSYFTTEADAIARWAIDCHDPEAYVHCEIDPSTLLGTSASLIPFPDYNQAPRNTYAASMSQQAKAVSSLDCFDKLENGQHILHYGQQPIVQTMQEKITGNNELPYGCNAVVAVLCKGYTQEDAVVVNKRFLDLGGLRSTYYRVFHDEERNNGNNNGPDVERFKKPDPSTTVGVRTGNYDHLDPQDGLPFVGATLGPGDAIMGKTILVAGAGKEGRHEQIERDRSRMMRHDAEKCTVDKVVISDTRDGLKSVHVKLRSMRIPEEADKLAARHGQKGVIGRIEQPENMPFCGRTGMSPDIILSPLAFPSRMTQGMLVEMIAGKAACFEGKVANGTAFANADTESYSEALKRNGYHSMGNEQLIDGETGELIEAEIFMGVCYYMALKHIVHEKIHARARGPRHPLTRQPPEGKTRNGGLRFGEMERDTIISHGAAAVLQGRTNQSDATIVVVCKQCGNIADKARPSDRSLSGLFVTAAEHYCRVCESGEHVHEVAMPYTMVLLSNELGGMNVKTTFELSEKPEE